MSGLANEETWSTLTFLREQTTKDFILSRKQHFLEINRDIFVSLEQQMFDVHPNKEIFKK